VHSRAFAAVAVIVSLIAVAFVGFPHANAAPPQPHNFYGTAADSLATPYPVGTRITAWIDGVDYSNGTSVYVIPPGPLGNYDMDVFGDNQTDVSGTGDNTPTVKTGGDINDEIMYMAGDFTTVKPLNPQHVFTAKDFWGSPTTGQSERLNLTAATTQPGLLKIGRIVTQPNDPWPQYLFLCNPTLSVIDASQYYLEKPVPGSFAGPTHPLSGPAPPGLSYVNLTSWAPSGTTLATTGDALKLVWINPGGANAPFLGTDVIVDRVEFNQTFDPLVFVEPVNTIMTDASAPGLGQEIARIGANDCQDTNSNSVDFIVRGATARPPPIGGNTAPSVTISTPSGGESWTGGTVHTVFWNQSDAEDASLTVTIDAGTDGISWPAAIFGGTRSNGANSVAWTVPCTPPFGNSTTVRVRAQVFDSGLLQGISITSTFEIDCSRPTLDNVVPPMWQSGVSVNTDVTLTFSEAMNQGATNGAISIAPGPVLFNPTWTTPQTVVVDPTLPLVGNTMYTVTVSCAATDDSDPGNNLAACPRTSIFNTTTADPAPTVDLTDPDGLEVWTGASAHTIWWNMSDNTPGDLTTTLEYSTNGAAGPWTAIFTNLPRAQGVNSFAWTVLCPSTTTARVRVTASDGVPQSSFDISAANFSIDCSAPTIISTSPGDGDFDVGVGDPITIIFSEPMEQATVTTPPAFSIAPAVSGISFVWLVPDTLQVTHNDFATCTQYTVTVAATAEDLSDPGNAMGTAFTWSFATACAPTVSISAPVGGEAFTGGFPQTLRFNLTDTDDPVFVWINWTSPVPGPIGSPGFRSTAFEQVVSFSVPFGNTTAAQIQVTAQDSTNEVGSDTVTFEIDSRPPSVTLSVPADGALNVGVTSSFTITFSEAMDRTTTGGAIGLIPSGGTLTFTWTSTRTVVTVTHAQALTTTTWYNLTVSSSARDTSRPGNLLSPDYRAAFRTSATGAATADAGGPYTGLTGTNVQLDGSGSSSLAGTIENWTWEITPQGGGAARFAFTETPTVQFATAGIYTIRLTVLDSAGNVASATTTATITAGLGGSNFLADYWWVFLILILAILGALFFLLGKRRKKEEEPMPPEVPPGQVETMPPSRAPAWEPPPPPPPAAPMAPSKGKPMTRECPTCGTIVDTTDTECFMCGTKL